MEATKITNQEINRLLREGISLHPDMGSLAIAAWVRASIRKEDRDDALLILLENQLSKVFSYDRERVPSRSNSIAAIRDSGVDPVEADKTLGRFAPMSHRVWARGKARSISQAEAREEIRIEDDAASQKLKEDIGRLVGEFAETSRKADIADALNRRVMVRREWKMLLDCTLEEVEWLATCSTNIALGHIHSAAFYADIVNRMRESGAETVSQLTPTEVSA